MATRDRKRNDRVLKWFDAYHATETTATRMRAIVNIILVAAINSGYADYGAGWIPFKTEPGLAPLLCELLLAPTSQVIKVDDTIAIHTFDFSFLEQADARFAELLLGQFGKRKRGHFIGVGIEMPMMIRVPHK